MIARIERRDGRTIAYDEEGLCEFSLPGELPDETVREIARLLDRRFTTGERAGRAAHARELRKLLDDSSHTGRIEVEIFTGTSSTEARAMGWIGGDAREGVES